MRGVEYGDPHIEASMAAELRARLAEGRPLRVYAGFDPTSTELTLGNLVPMLKLRQFQEFGHEVTFLMGTMTGIVGDPSDKAAARQMLTTEQVEVNSETWVSQAFRVLDQKKTVVKRNGAWLAPLTLADLVQVASNFTVSQFLERETFRQRLAESKPIYVHEFIYALMQAYDAHVLKTDVQIGGVDQLFNIMAGRQLQRALDEKPLVALTTPLLIGTDGHLKMSKSVGNYVGLDDAPVETYGKVMSIPDALIANWLTLLTDVPGDEIAAVERGIAERTLNPMEAKKRLAREIVTLLNGPQAATEAEAAFERVFQRREEPEEAIEVPWNGLPFVHGFTGPAAEVKLPNLIAKYIGVSVSEGRRLITEGGVEIDGVKAEGTVVQVAPGSIIKVGRHRFIRVVEG